MRNDASSIQNMVEHTQYKFRQTLHTILWWLDEFEEQRERISAILPRPFPLNKQKYYQVQQHLDDECRIELKSLRLSIQQIVEDYQKEVTYFTHASTQKIVNELTTLVKGQSMDAMLRKIHEDTIGWTKGDERFNQVKNVLIQLPQQIIDTVQRQKIDILIGSDASGFRPRCMNDGVQFGTTTVPRVDDSQGEGGNNQYQRLRPENIREILDFYSQNKDFTHDEAEKNARDVMNDKGKGHIYNHLQNIRGFGLDTNYEHFMNIEIPDRLVNNFARQYDEVLDKCYSTIEPTANSITHIIKRCTDFLTGKTPSVPATVAGSGVGGGGIPAVGGGGGAPALPHVPSRKGVGGTSPTLPHTGINPPGYQGMPPNSFQPPGAPSMPGGSQPASGLGKAIEGGLKGIADAANAAEKMGTDIARAAHHGGHDTAGHDHSHDKNHDHHKDPKHDKDAHHHGKHHGHEHHKNDHAHGKKKVEVITDKDGKHVVVTYENKDGSKDIKTFNVVNGKLVPSDLPPTAHTHTPGTAPTGNSAPHPPTSHAAQKPAVSSPVSSQPANTSQVTGTRPNIPVVSVPQTQKKDELTHKGNSYGQQGSLGGETEANELDTAFE